MTRKQLVLPWRPRFTTLWGSVLANVFFLPVADKLKFRSNDAKLSLLISIDGVMAIQGGQNPRVIATVLAAYLDPTKAAKADSSNKGSTEVAMSQDPNIFEEEEDDGPAQGWLVTFS